LIDVWVGLIGAGSGGAAAAFGWLQNLTALAALNAWGEKTTHMIDLVESKLTRTPNLAATIAYAAARMSQAFKKQGISRDTIPFRAPLSPWVQYFSSFFCSVIILFSGFSVFLNGNWSTSDFFANYISESSSVSLGGTVADVISRLYRSFPLYRAVYRLQDHQKDEIRQERRRRPLLR
jgi:hypothetical protein